jgi:hypothetical protein
MTVADEAGFGVLVFEGMFRFNSALAAKHGPAA